jgi:hypothetical protein
MAAGQVVSVANTPMGHGGRHGGSPKRPARRPGCDGQSMMRDERMALGGCVDGWGRTTAARQGRD